VVPKRSVKRDPSLLLIELFEKTLGMTTKNAATHPEKKAAIANVAYRAVFAFALVVASTWPPPPRPFKALNNPGHMKQTKPNIAT
jgi:hypothetical protein